MGGIFLWNKNYQSFKIFNCVKEQMCNKLVALLAALCRIDQHIVICLQWRYLKRTSTIGFTHVSGRTTW